MPPGDSGLFRPKDMRVFHCGLGMSGFAGRGCAPAFLWVAPKEKPPRPVEKKGAWAQNGASRLICLKYEGPRKRPWWSLSDSALGAGPVLLNLLAFCHANRNCEDGQKSEGPAFLFALPASLSATWAVAEEHFEMVRSSIKDQHSFYCLALRHSQYFRHQCSTGSSFRVPRCLRPKSRLSGGWPPKRACGRSRLALPGQLRQCSV